MASLMQNIIDKNKPIVSKYIDNLLENAREDYGEESSEYLGIYNQYYLIPSNAKDIATNSRHFHAEVDQSSSGGLERMYKRVVVIDLISACASECSYCVRGYYNIFSLSEDNIKSMIKEISVDKYLKEVLITGGDPLISQRKLIFVIKEVIKHAKNIKFIRIGTRLPVQTPSKIDKKLYDFFNEIRDDITIEIACQINHPFELQSETIEVFKILYNSGVSLYSQNVLLKGVNDNISTLLELYDKLRYLKILPHYLFHAVPLKGTEQFRTSVHKGLELIQLLTSSGHISGRAKPQYALITDIGKITLYSGSVQLTDEEYLTIKSSYTLSDRLIWNKNYVLPNTAIINIDNTLSVKYLDGSDY